MRVRFALFTAVLLGFAGCAAEFNPFAFSTADESPVSAEVALRLFAARSFLGGSDYERYALNGQELWRECGAVRDGRRKLPERRQSLEGDQALGRDPSLYVLERRAERLSPTERNAVARRIQKVLQSTATEVLSPPGGLGGINDAGVLELSLRLGEEQKRLVTSVDAVADSDSPRMEDVRGLVATLRGLGPPLCGAETFYGIGRAAK